LTLNILGVIIIIHLLPMGGFTVKKNINLDHTVCYLRRSRQDLEREKRTGEDTLSTQKKIMEKVLNELCIPYKMVEEIGSGDKIETRPVFQQVLQLLKDGKYDSIAVKEIARLGRGSYSDMGLIFDIINEKNIYIITPYKIYDINNSSDARQIRFELFFAREEYEMIKERMLSAKLSLAHEGRWVVGATPYGYSLNKKTTRLQINEEEAKIVKMIFDLYVNGILVNKDRKKVSYRAIAGHLNRIGIPGIRSNKWNINSVRRILMNEAYIGILKYRTRYRIKNKYYKRPLNEWIVVHDAHEPIIDLDTWKQARFKMDSNSINVKNNFEQCELAGLVTCSKCGKRMVRQNSVQHYKKKDGTESIYNKEFLSCLTNGCTYVKYREVEKEILNTLVNIISIKKDELKDFINNHYIVASTENKPDYKINCQEIEARINKQIDSKKRKLNFVYENYENGVYTKEVFFERLKIVEDEIEQLKNYKIEDITSNDDIDYDEIYNVIQFNIENLLSVYNEVGKTTRNKLLLSAIKQVFLNKISKGNFELNVIPRI